MPLCKNRITCYGCAQTKPRINPIFKTKLEDAQQVPCLRKTDLDKPQALAYGYRFRQPFFYLRSKDRPIFETCFGQRTDQVSKSLFYRSRIWNIISESIPYESWFSTSKIKIPKLTANPFQTRSDYTKRRPNSTRNWTEIEPNQVLLQHF